MSLDSLLQARPATELRSGIAGAGVVPPHAFIRGLDADYDLEVMLDRWLRPLDAQDDFRFRSIDPDGGERWVLMERLPWDSDFFGRGMAPVSYTHSPSPRDRG